MTVTTWDGHVRVDYLPARARLQVTVLTVEAVAEAEIRPGLRAAFVATDPSGPPSFIGVNVPGGAVPTDVRVLLGTTLAALADTVLAEPPRERWTRLDLAQVAELADGWAPYRARVLATVPAEEFDAEPDLLPDEAPRRRYLGWRAAVGAWAGDKWTSFGGEDLTTGLRRLLSVAPDVAFRDGPREIDSAPDPPRTPDTAEGIWQLPPELAAAAGVVEQVRWSARPRALGVAVTFRATPVGDSAPDMLFVAFDDGRERWMPFAADATGDLVAAVLSTSDVDFLPGVRFRTANRGTDDQ